MRYASRAFPALLAAAVSSSAGPLCAAELEVELAESLEAQMREARVPGLQIAIATDSALQWSRGLGLGDVEQGTPITPDTALRAGSVSKLFTAALVMQQVERGVLALDEDVNRYLPEARRIRDPNGQPVRVTIRQLLSHRSGLPPIGAGVGAVRTLQILAGFAGPPSYTDYLARGLVLRRTPGAALRYSNDAFILLGWLCGSLAGRDFAQYAREALLEPLGMNSSDFDPDVPELRARRARVYDRTEGGFEPAREWPGVWPSGSLLTTAEDLLRFASMAMAGGVIDGRRLLAHESVTEMTRLQSVPVEGAVSGFGLGFRVTTYRGQLLWCHEGGNPGIAARVCMLPAQRVAVAALVNVNDEDFVYVAVNRVLDRILGAAPAPAARLPETASRIVGRYRPVDMAPDTLGLLEAMTQIRIEARGGALRVALPGRPEWTLVPTSDPWAFELRGGQGEGEILRFREGPDGRLDAFASVFHIRKAPVWATPAGLATAAALAAAACAMVLGASRWRRGRPLR